MTRIVGVLFLLIGLGAFIAAGALAVSSLRFKADAEKATGTIVKLERRTSSSSGGRGRTGRKTATWAPVFEFAAAGGATQLVTSAWSSSHTSLKVGDPVPVLYPRHAPHQARIDTFDSFWTPPLIFLAIGAVFAAFAVVIVRKRG